MTEQKEASTAGTRRVLAVCYVLPPALYPQAIQIGRLLSHSRHTIGEVCGPLGQAGAGNAERAGGRGTRFVVADPPPRHAALHRLALRTLPLYGAVPDEQRAWAVRAGRELLGARWLEELAPEAMITFGEPMSDHVLGLMLKQQLRLPWIAHFSDPWSDNPFRRPHKMARRLNAGLEAQVISAADAVIFTSDETADLFRNKYGARIDGKVHTLPHSLEPALYRQPSRAADDEGGPLVARYLGNFYGHRTPLPVLRALDRLAATRPDIACRLRVEFVGGVQGWMRLHPLVRNADPARVSFQASVPYQRSLDLIVDADLLLVVDAPAKTSLFLPSKLIDYLGAGRPILGAVPPGPSKRLIARIGGWTAEPRDSAGLAEAFAEFVADPDRRAAIAARAREVATEYEASRVAARFDAIVSATAALNTSTNTPRASP